MEGSAARQAVSVRLSALIAVALVPALTGASAKTTNFVVEAPTGEMARRVAEHAEACRKALAMAWLGKELPDWPQPCPIRVKLTEGEAGGRTSFGFARGHVSDQEITVEGRIERILAVAIPHEVTHTIFAAYFGGPMPRWADEGASVLSEDRREKDRHDHIVAQLLARRGDLPLTRLFQLEEYPSDLWGFYGQGYSVSRFLVEIGGRARFLEFVRDGLHSGWDNATRSHYGLSDVRELDRAWHSWHKVLADAGQGRPAAPVVVRAQSRAEPAGE
ncbi:MAG TPA: hypothetical protein VGZ22_18800 [Isosphaeraceae bacterium]|jgi:hypothetical protein|nr:hypothetical protein [Isosphaeraceae bacterium]